MKLIYLCLITCILASCTNYDTNNLFQEGKSVLYCGTYHFNEVESTTICTWLRPDSTFFLLKKKDQDSIYIGVFGKWKVNNQIFTLDSGNDGRLIVKTNASGLEVLNNEGCQINRDKKFILEKTDVSDFDTFKIQIAGVFEKRENGDRILYINQIPYPVEFSYSNDFDMKNDRNNKDITETPVKLLISTEGSKCYELKFKVKIYSIKSILFQ